MLDGGHNLIVGQGDFLRDKSFEIGLVDQLGVGQPYANTGMDAIGEQNGFLFVDPSAAWGDVDEEIAFGDSASSLLYL